MSKAYLPALGALGLLLIHGVLAYHSLRIKSVTYDELTHLPAGMANVATGEIVLNRQHPPLVKWLAGLAANTTHPEIPLDGEAFAEKKEWHFGAELLFSERNDHWQILRRGRTPTVALSMLGGLVVFLWARRRSGDAGAFFALGLWTFSPSLLAHARWVTMDAAVTALGMLTLYLWWRLCQYDSEGRKVWGLTLGTGVALGLTLGAKFSGLVLIPAMALADVLVHGLPSTEPVALIKRRAAQWSVIAVSAWLTLWCLYLFPTDPFVYFTDLGNLYADLKSDYRFYLAGSFQAGNFPHYFLATYLLKSTPVELLVTVAVFPLMWVHRRRDNVFLVVPAGAWFVATSLLASNQGHRYILLLYPLVFVLAAEAVPALASVQRRTLVIAVLVALPLGQALETLGHHPDYLPYFNRMAGGPLAGPYWLDDSNVDWNQDIGRLAPWLEAKGIGPVYTVFFGNTDPEFYGIERRPFLRSDWKDGPRPGAYVVSAHVLSRGLELKQFEGYNSDWLLRYEPEDVLGGSLYLYVFP